jgi:hypothetical protein
VLGPELVMVNSVVVVLPANEIRMRPDDYMNKRTEDESSGTS